MSAVADMEESEALRVSRTAPGSYPCRAKLLSFSLPFARQISNLVERRIRVQQNTYADIVWFTRI